MYTNEYTSSTLPAERIRFMQSAVPIMFNSHNSGNFICSDVFIFQLAADRTCLLLPVKDKVKSMVGEGSGETRGIMMVLLSKQSSFHTRDSLKKNRKRWEFDTKKKKEVNDRSRHAETTKKRHRVPLTIPTYNVGMHHPGFDLKSQKTHSPPLIFVPLAKVNGYPSIS
jgi:hypothetical protein